METEVEDNKKKFTKFTRVCDECGKDYEAVFPRSRYCSDKCKNAWHRKNKSAKMSEVKTKDKTDEKESNEYMRSPIVIPPGLSPQASYIVGHQEKEIARLTKLYDDERASRKKLKGKYEDLKDQLTKMETDHKIEAIENAKPSGLSGLAENPLIQQLLPHIGPALGMFAERMLAPANGLQMGGVQGQLDEAGQREIVEINQWYAQLPKPSQQLTYDILNKFATTKPDQLDKVLTRIQNLLKNGTATTHNGTNQATGTY